MTENDVRSSGVRAGEGGPLPVEIVEFVAASDRAALEKAWAVRTEVFVGEQRVPEEEEIDDLDTAPSTIHVIALEPDSGADAPALGTARLLGEAHEEVRHIGRMAVRREARGRHVGEVLMRALEARALAQARAAGLHGVVVELSAQEQAMGFYARLGYEVVSGESYLDAGIPHQDMANTLR